MISCQLISADPSGVIWRVRATSGILPPLSSPRSRPKPEKVCRRPVKSGRAHRGDLDIRNLQILKGKSPSPELSGPEPASHWTNRDIKWIKIEAPGDIYNSEWVPGASPSPK